MPKFQILKDKREITFHSNDKKIKKLWFLKFLCPAILDFMLCNGCPIVLKQNIPCFQTIAATITIIKFKVVEIIFSIFCCQLVMRVGVPLNK